MTRFSNFISRLQVSRKPGNKAVVRQYFEMIYLFLRRHLSPIEYQLYQMGRKDASMGKLDSYLVTSWVVRRMRPRLNSRLWEPVLLNKVLFNQHMQRHDLPVARLFGMFHPQFGYREQGQLKTAADLKQMLHTVTAKEIIIKPLDGLKGKDISRFRVENGQLLDAQGNESSTKDVAAGLSLGNGFLVEECLQNHPLMAAYNSSSLNTCRVVTFVNRRGECRVLFATARFGRAGQVTDNWSAGGVAVGLDLETGTMGRGLLLPKYGGKWLDCHPDSDKPFVGQVIPNWQQIMVLVQRAALALPWCRSVGWDMAVTPQGPVFVEGNGQWNPSIGQAFSGGLLTSELRQDLKELGLPTC